MPLRDTCPICGAHFRAGIWRHIEICADRAYREDAEKVESERSKRAIENSRRLVGQALATEVRQKRF